MRAARAARLGRVPSDRRQLHLRGHQLEGDGDAFSDVAFGPDGPVHGLDQPAAERRAKAGPARAPSVLGPDAGFEDPGQVFGGEAGAGVADPAFEAHAVDHGPGLQTRLHRAPAGGLDRRGDQIVEDLSQARAIDHDAELGLAIIGHQHRDV